MSVEELKKTVATLSADHQAELSAFLFHVLPVTEETADLYATIRVELKATGSPIPANDAWIAALARQHRLPIVSQDAHFDRVKNIDRVGWRAE